MKTKAEIIQELMCLSERMIDCGTAMEYCGGSAWIAECGREMIGAGFIAKQWAMDWEVEDEKQS